MFNQRPFFRTKDFFFVNQIHWMVPNINLHFPSCVCLCICGPRISGFTPRTPHVFPTFLRSFTVGDHVSPRMLSLSPWGGSTQLAMPNTHIFHFQNLVTHFRCCPLLPSPPSGTKHSVDQPCPHDILSNSKHSVD